MTGAENEARDQNEELDDDLRKTMFMEPEGFFRPPPEPSLEYYERRYAPADARKAMINYLDVNVDLYRGKSVLELGAGSAIPSIVCALNGARKIFSTDYPDQPLLNTIELNMKENASELYNMGVLNCIGLVWGKDKQDILRNNPKMNSEFDLILMSDLIFNHHARNALLKTARDFISPNGVILVTFSHHVPRLAQKDMEFFSIAEKEFNLNFEKIKEELWTPMFPEDVGDLKDRSTVHFYKMNLKHN